MKTTIPDFDSGDTVKVDYKVVEGTRSRIQSYEGVVIARKNGKGARATFTVRKVSFGEGVERVFPVHSPLIDSITVVRRGRTRRAKLYYLRDLRGKAARLKTDVARQEVDRAAARVTREENVKTAAKAAEEAVVARAAAEVAAAKAAKEAAEAKTIAEAEAAKAAAAEAELKAKEAATAADEANRLAEESKAAEAAVGTNTAAVSASQDLDDLTKIEGIGPKYAEALRVAGIASFARVAKASVAEFQAAASTAEMSNAASMETWAKQAQMIVDGDEEGLKAYQEALDGGVEKE